MRDHKNENDIDNVYKLGNTNNEQHKIRLEYFLLLETDCKVCKSRENVWPVPSKGYITDNAIQQITNVFLFHDMVYGCMCHSIIHMLSDFLFWNSLSKLCYERYISSTVSHPCIERGRVKRGTRRKEGTKTIATSQESNQSMVFKSINNCKNKMKNGWKYQICI